MNRLEVGGNERVVRLSWASPFAFWMANGQVGINPVRRWAWPFVLHVRWTADLGFLVEPGVIGCWTAVEVPVATWREGPAGHLVDGAVGGEGFTHGALDGGEDLRRVVEPDFLLEQGRRMARTGTSG